MAPADEVVTVKDVEEMEALVTWLAATDPTIVATDVDASVVLEDAALIDTIAETNWAVFTLDVSAVNIEASWVVSAAVIDTVTIVAEEA